MNQISLASILAVFFGGGVGCVLRYIISFYSYSISEQVFPYHTLIINTVSCFIMGVAFAYFLSKAELANSIKMFVTVGFCGGLSTFSAYSLEVINLVNTNNYWIAFIYAVISVVFCLVAVTLGVIAGGFVARNS